MSVSDIESEFLFMHPSLMPESVHVHQYFLVSQALDWGECILCIFVYVKLSFESVSATLRWM